MNLNPIWEGAIMYKKVQIDIPTKSGIKYSIDTNGVIYNDTWGTIPKGRIKNGYHLICVQGIWKPIHRYVAFAFLPIIEGKTFVNHKDGNKSNNCVDNLEWCTHKENMQHAKKTGLWKPHVGVNHGMTRLTEQDVHVICQSISEGLSFKKVSIVGLTRHQFYSIKSRRTWKHISKEYTF